MSLFQKSLARMRVQKMNPNHDPKTGEFTSASGGGGSDDESEHPIGSTEWYTERSPKVAEAFKNFRGSLKDLNKIKNDLTKRVDAGEKGITDGAIKHFYDMAKEKLVADSTPMRSAAEVRLDRLLHVTDSSGKRTARPMGRL